MKVILASGSPRRRELLKLLEVPFEVRVSGVEERITKENPAEIVEELSRIKAEDIFAKEQEDVLVIGADTIVALEGKILGKPGSENEAAEMLRQLQGRTHQVYTGVTLLWRENGGVKGLQFHECTDVTFCPMSESEIAAYIATKEPMDKAGAYGIQGLGGRFVEKISGDYNNVVGLPVSRLYKEFRKIYQKPLDGK